MTVKAPSPLPVGVRPAPNPAPPAPNYAGDRIQMTATKATMLEYVRALKEKCNEDPGDESCRNCSLRKDHRRLLVFLEKICALFDSMAVYNP